MKICSKCKQEKDLIEFSIDKNTKDKLCYVCKECQNERNKKWRKKNPEHYKIYYEKNLEKLLEYREKNKKRKSRKSKEWYKDNKKEINKRHKKYKKSKANFNTYTLQISYADKVRNVDDFLQVKCTYCGKWYFPTVTSIQHRINALNGNASSEGCEMRLYCSKECKQACPIYGKILYQEGHPLKNQNSSREVQPELRQMVFERDEYTCLKCEKYQDDLNVPIHCHHIEGILWNPLESADIDQCMTVCKDCHKKIHKQNDCGYHDLQCKGKTI